MTSDDALPPSHRHPYRGLVSWVALALLLPPAAAAEPAPQLRKTLGGTEDVGRVRCLAFSPDGNTLFSGSLNGSIRLWDLESDKGTTVGKFKVPVLAVAFRPGGKTFAALPRSAIGFWDARTRKELAWLPENDTLEQYLSIAFTPDGKTLVTAALEVPDCGQVHTLQVWDVDARKRKAVFGGYEHAVHGVSISPDGKTVASASSDGVWLWDLKTGKNTAKITAGEGDCFQSVLFSPDSKTLATAGGGADDVVRLWDAKTRKLKLTLEGHNNGVFCLAFTPDGKTLISGSFDTHVRLWDVKTGKNTATLRDHKDEVLCVAVSPDGKTLATGSSDRTILLWDLSSVK